MISIRKEFVLHGYPLPFSLAVPEQVHCNNQMYLLFLGYGSSEFCGTETLMLIKETYGRRN